MSLQRIRFGGSGAPATWTTLGINPIEVDFQDSYNQDVIPTLDGESVIHQGIFDFRLRQLIWRGINADNAIFSVQLATMQKYLHKVFYVCYGDIETRIHSINTWEKYRCSDIVITMQPRGKLKYDSVIMYLLPAKT